MLDLPVDNQAPAEVISVEASPWEDQAFIGILGNQTRFQLPFTQSSYDRSLFEKQGSVSANQVLKNDAALSNVSTVGGFSGFNLSFRGFPSGADAISFNGMGPGAMFSGSLGQLYSIERLEVIKGPSAALGAFSPQASVGGSVNVVPKKAIARPVTSLTLAVREKGIASAHVDVNRKLSETLSARLNLAAEKGQSFYRGMDERRVFALAMTYQPTSTLKFELGYDSVHVRSEGYQNAFVLAPGVKLPKAPSPLQQHFQRWSYLEQEWEYGYGNLEWKLFDKTTFVLQTMQGERRRPILSTGTGLIVNDSGTMILRPNYLAPGTVYDPFYGVNASLNSEQVTGSVKHDLNLSFLYNGFDFKNAISSPLATIRSDLYHPIYVDRPSLNELKTGRVSEVDSRSYALTDTLRYDQWRVLVGAKNTTLSFDNYDVSSGIRTTRQNDTVNSPLAALSFDQSESFTHYLSFAEGLEKGGIAPSTAANANEIMDSNVNRQLELGSKWKLNDAAMANLAIFQIERNLEYLDPISNFYRQDGLQRNRGLEIQIQGQITPRLHLTAGGMVIDAKVVKSGAWKGKRPAGVPYWTLPLLVDYQWSDSNSFMLGLYHFDKQFIDAANTQRLDAWTRFDAGISHRLIWQDYKLTASAYVENIGNQHYWSSAAGGQLALGSPEIWKFSLKAEL